MPEGDTLYRTAQTLRHWLVGRRITDARSRIHGFPAPRLVGATVESVEARGKHLLVRLDSGHAVHTHLRMTGSWHVYPVGERWRRPEAQARLVLQAGDRVAVCFNAPVVELIAARAEQAHPSLGRLGPDVLGDPVDRDEIRRRARVRPSELALGELLLDQRVVSGIGNIWRCEALFCEGRHPLTPQSSLSDEELDALVDRASTLMRASTKGSWQPQQRWVYRRTGRPCRRCGAAIESRRHGEHTRRAYWCPRCQPAS
jgi:endonuclease-8